MSYLAKTTSKGHDYYKIMESYRENGKPKHRQLYNIGSLSNLFALLPDYVKQGTTPPIPNAIVTPSVSVSVDPVRCRCHGSPYLLYSVAEWLGVEDIMTKFFKAGTAHGIPRSRSLLLGAIHRACQPGSKSEFAEWFMYTSLPDYLSINPAVMTSQHFWEQMDEITVDQIKEFETELFRKILAQFPELKGKINCLSSDFTNYFTYISTQNYRCQIAQLGHSKEGRTGQRIFSVAVVTTPLLGIPIATLVYKGNLNDKTALKLFMDELKTRLSGLIDLSDITFVFDGGGVSEEVLDSICGHYITRGMLKSSPELYAIPLSSYDQYTLDSGRKVNAYRTVSTQYGKPRTCVVTLSDDLRAGQEAELNKQLLRFNSNITELNKSLENSRATRDKRKQAIADRVTNMLLPAFHFSDFIDVDYETMSVPDPFILREFRKAYKSHRKENKQEPFVFEVNGLTIKEEKDIPLAEIVTKVNCTVNETKKTAMCDKYYGKHLLITDHDNWATDRILNVYRDQEFIERFFRDSKDTSHFSVRPAFHWTDQKIPVHVMMCYLGLTLCRVAQYLLSRNFQLEISSQDLLDQLEKVQECLVIIIVNGEKLKPTKTISQLEEQEEKTWQKVSSLMKYMSDNPAKEI